MNEKEYEAWRKVVQDCADQTEDAKVSDFCSEVLSVVDVLEEIKGDLRHALVSDAVDIARRCLIKGPSTIMTMQSLLNGLEAGKAIIVTEPELIGPVAGHA
jgi:hypothetical protein